MLPTYYGGLYGFSFTNTEAASRVYIPVTGTITAVYLMLSNSGTAGTSETSTVSIRLNNTTDTTVSAAVVSDTGAHNYSNTALAIAVVAGDFIALKWVAPTWATNPGTCYSGRKHKD
jgi:hypothetical protein